MDNSNKLILDEEIYDFYNKIDVHQSYISTVYDMLFEKMKSLRKSDFKNLYIDYRKLQEINRIEINKTRINNLDEALKFDGFKSLGFNEIEDVKDKLLNFPDKLMEEIINKLDFRYGVGFSYDKNDEYPSISINFKSKIERDNFNDFVSQYNKIEKQIRILFETSLINLTNIFEFFIQSIVYNWVQAFPNSLNSSEKTITYGELINTKDLESLHQRIINDYVRSFMFGSSNEWFIKLSKNNKNLAKKIDVKEIKIVNEIFARRNIVVHNNGIVNSSYLSIVEDSEFIEGEEVGLSFDYLDNIANDLLVTGLKIAFYYWEVQSENKDLFESKFNLFEQNIGLELIKNNKPKTAAKVLKILIDEKSNYTRVLSLRLAINYALALKDSGFNYKEVIDSEDFSVCGDEHNLCLAALDDNIEEVIKYFKLIVSSNLEHYEFLIDWPVLKNVKNDAKFQKFIKVTYKNKVKQFDDTIKDKVESENKA